MPSGQIGNYKYYTLDDIQYMIYNAQDDNTEEEAWCIIKKNILDIATLVKQYADMLNNYEFRYEDDGR